MLSCYRVLDLTTERGYLCGKILSDMGADVIKVEPPSGEPGRRVGPFYQDSSDPNRSLHWFAHNTSKRSITLDIETDDGKRIFRKLLGTADLVIESFDPGYLDNLGLGYSAVSKINPRVVMTSITPFGQNGPYSKYKGSDMVVWALGGLMYVTGDADRPPVQVSLPQSYIATSTYAAEGTMVALYARNTLGEGQHVDVSAMETIAWIAGEAFPSWFTLGENKRRSGPAATRGGVAAPVIWPSRDGHVSYILQTGLPGGDRNTRMASWLETEGLATEFIKTTDWFKLDWMDLVRGGIGRLVDPLAKLFLSHTNTELFDEALKREISLYPVADSKETLENVQLAERKFWVRLPHSELKADITYPGPFAVLSDKPIQVRHRAPLIGEHNDDIYRGELGFSKEELRMFVHAGVI